MSVYLFLNLSKVVLWGDTLFDILVDVTTSKLLLSAKTFGVNWRKKMIEDVITQIGDTLAPIQYEVKKKRDEVQRVEDELDKIYLMNRRLTKHKEPKEKPVEEAEELAQIRVLNNLKEDYSTGRWPDDWFARHIPCLIQNWEDRYQKRLENAVCNTPAPSECSITTDGYAQKKQE